MLYYKRINLANADRPEIKNLSRQWTMPPAAPYYFIRFLLQIRYYDKSQVKNKKKLY
jgi:hypothetical protein